MTNWSKVFLATLPALGKSSFVGDSSGTRNADNASQTAQHAPPQGNGGTNDHLRCGIL